MRAILVVLLLAVLGAGIYVFATDGIQGPVEELGQRMDNTAERVTEGRRDLRDGPLEQAGERVDRALDRAADSVETRR
ncbi:MAG TPA: hypothetical protein VEY95_16730 [Azospirillaceae bacterium]|nr:hypothetical protein [Azospirillaceae bacterium]